MSREFVTGNGHSINWNWIWLIEIERVLSGAKDGQREETPGGKKFCDVTKDKPIKVTVRTSVPTRDHPKVPTYFI